MADEMETIKCERACSCISPCFLLIGIAAAQDMSIHVPLTRSCVMIDGVLSTGEWKNAPHVEVPGTAKIYFQRSAEFVYIAIQYTSSPSGIVDLYLSPASGQIYDFHASAKLGERELHGKSFSDWEWWNNHDWTANVSRVDSFEKHTFKPAPVREYQIKRLRFSSPEWRVRIELTSMGANSETKSVAVFPNGAASTSTAGWVTLVLDHKP